MRARLWAVCVRRLGLDPKTCLYTPASAFHALLEVDAEVYRDLMVGPAQTSVVLANVHRDPKKRKRPYSMKDFLPADPRARRKPTSQSLAEVNRWADGLLAAGIAQRVPKPTEVPA